MKNTQVSVRCTQCNILHKRKKSRLTPLHMYCSRRCYATARTPNVYTYKALHQWISRNYPKSHVCSHCNRPDTATQWANVSHEYKKDIKDFIELCVSCHARFDNRITNMTGANL